MPHEYYLITKNLNRKFVKYKGTAQRLSSQKPYSYDEVIIGKYGKFEDISIITTFRDSKGNIIERCFDIVGKPLKNRLYTVRENTIGEDKIVKSTHIKQYSIKRKYYERCKNEISEINNKTLFFTPEKFETHHISTNINTGEKVFSHVIQSNLTKPTKEIHTFVEYPHIIGGKIQKAKKKMLEFIVNTINYKIAPNSVKAQGIRVPKHDEYLRNHIVKCFISSFINYFGELRAQVKIIKSRTDFGMSHCLRKNDIALINTCFAMIVFFYYNTIYITAID